MKPSALLLKNTVQLLEHLEYEDPSLTILVSSDAWRIGVDLGAEVEDVLEWEGQYLATILSEVHRAVSVRPRRAFSSKITVNEDFDLCDDIINDIKPRLGRGMLDIAYVPRSKLPGGQSWEVHLQIDHVDEIWSGSTLREPLEESQRSIGSA